MRVYDDGVYRDATSEEIDALEKEVAQHPTLEPTAEERIDALEVTTDDIILMMAELIGGE